METTHLVQEVSERLVAHMVGGRSFEWLDVWLTGGDQRIAIRADGSDDDLGDSDARLSCHERRERLVLDLLQAADGCAARGVAVRKQAPAPGQSLRVLGVVVEQADLQRASIGIVADVFRRADVLLR
jgi:hypothetical protein